MVDRFTVIFGNFHCLGHVDNDCDVCFHESPCFGKPRLKVSMETSVTLGV